jgi:hypothetical protein
MKKLMTPPPPVRSLRPDRPAPSEVAPPVPRGATLQQVADAAGVHRSTASRALNPETAGMISPDVVARVAGTAQSLGYRRDMLAASLRTSRTRLVGMLLPDLGNPVFAPILAGVEAALAEHRYAVLIAHAPNDASALELLESFVARRAEGLILATAHAHDRCSPAALNSACPRYWSTVPTRSSACLQSLPMIAWECVWSCSTSSVWGIAASAISQGRRKPLPACCGPKGSKAQ